MITKHVEKETLKDDDIFLFLVASGSEQTVSACLESVFLNLQFDGLQDGVKVYLIDPDRSAESVLKAAGDGGRETGYICLEEGETIGSVMNRILEIAAGHMFFLLDARMLLTPGCLKTMIDVMEKNQDAAMVNPLSNAFLSVERKPKKDVNSYEEALSSAMSKDRGEDVHHVMNAEAGAVLCNSILIQKTGGFDERFEHITGAFLDFSFRCQIAGRKLLSTDGALVYGIAEEVQIREAHIEIYKEDLAVLKDKWGMHYFNIYGNANLVDMMEEADHTREMKVLEIGCDLGATLFLLRDRYPNADVYGYELNENAVAIAKHYIHAEVGNIEKEELPFSAGSLDYVIFGDVLEHLHDPYKTLRYIRRFLKPDGKVIASIPNVMHISVVLQLLHGDFTYTEIGLLDKTHIHLFTYNEIIKMLEQTGFRPRNIRHTLVSITDEQLKLMDTLMKLDTGVSRYMYEAFQYLVLAENSAEDQSGI